MAFAPLQIHMSQHALIDGFFAFWAMLALWRLWENLRRPKHPGWLAALGVALFLMVLTKENAFFVYVALVGLVATNRWTRFGEVTPALLLVGIVAPLLGAGDAGEPRGRTGAVHRDLPAPGEQCGASRLCHPHRRGPWYRYLLDSLVLSPLTVCLAIGAIFCVLRENRACLYLLGFVACSYLIMCNVPHGMNLRYATIWDLPLRVLVFAQLAWVCTYYKFSTRVVLPLAVAVLCAYDLNQYLIFFFFHPLYELAPDQLLEAVQILK